MVDVFTIKKRSDIMSRVLSKGNKFTELALIQIFRKHRISGWKRGVTIGVSDSVKPLLIRPDFVFRKQRIVIFVDGEFWHGHPTRAKIPQSNREFWAKKIQGNKMRDRFQNRILKKNGWTVVRIWQFELKTKAAFRKLVSADLVKKSEIIGSLKKV